VRAFQAAVLIVLGGLFLDAGPVPQPQPASDEVLTNEALVKLVKAGVRDDVIVAMINRQPGQYSASPKAVIAMKKAGVSDNIIAAARREFTAIADSDIQSALGHPTLWPRVPSEAAVAVYDELVQREEAQAELESELFGGI
jgi:hypothetical protein